MSDRPSRLDLARLVSGDMPDAEARQLRAAVERSPELQQQLAELEANQADYARGAEQQRAALLARLRQQPEGARRTRWWWALAPAAVAAAAALLLLLRLNPGQPPSTAPIPRTGPVAFKGDLAVRVVARRGDQQFVARPGLKLRAGDALRFVVTSGAPGYLSVLSIDGAGTLSPFYPEGEEGAPLRLSRAGRHELPGSVILDAAPGPERLFVIFSPDRFDRRAVHRRLAGLVRAGKPVAPAALGLAGEVWSLAAPKEPGR